MFRNKFTCKLLKGVRGIFYRKGDTGCDIVKKTFEENNVDKLYIYQLCRIYIFIHSNIYTYLIRKVRQWKAHNTSYNNYKIEHCQTKHKYKKGLSFVS